MGPRRAGLQETSMGSNASASDDPDRLTRRSVSEWARALIDLSQRNHALYHRPTKRASLDLEAPDSLTLHRLLSAGESLPFLLPPTVGDTDDDDDGSRPKWTVARSIEVAGPKHVVTDRVDGQDLHRTLTNLMRTTNQDWLDRAVRTLYVAFGQLTWSEDLDGRDEVRSPLIYLPVTLRRGGARDPFLLESADEDPILNPSLVMKLDDMFGLDLLPLAERMTELSTIDEVLEEVEELTDDLGWKVSHAASLKRATFHKESMYRDLVQNLETIAGHPIVRSLAGVPSGRTEPPDADVPDRSELDVKAPPDDAHLVLDADESQRRAVLAALLGVSFVMDGPPGTGKSQTIVNMIAELIAAGRSVLFVSEKAAALEVVAKRLADVGLSDFILELHSHKANRREVVQELGRALRQQPQASGGMNAAERARLAQRRRELNEYSEAVNEERAPLARSVGWVAGRAAQLHGAPELTPATVDLEQFDLATFETIMEDVRVLALSWDRVRDVDFLWRDAESDGRPGPEPARQTLRAVRTALDALLESAGELSSELGLTTPCDASDVAQLLMWATTLASRPADVPPSLLRLDEQARRELRRHISDIRDSARELEDLERVLEQRYPGGWRDARLPSHEQVDAARATLRAVSSGVGTTRRLTRELLHDGHSIAASLVAETDRILLAIADVGERCGADSGAFNLEQAGRIARVAGSVRSPRRPDPTWLDAKTAFAVESALEELKRRQGAARNAWRRVDGLLRPEAMDLDLEAAVRALRRSSGIVARFGTDARAARRVLREALRRDPRDIDDSELELALKAWNAQRELRSTEERHAQILTRFQRDGRTDLVAAGDALGLAMDVRRAGGDHFRPDVAARQFCGSRPEDPDLESRGRRLLADLEQLEASLARLDGLGVSFPRSITVKDLVGTLGSLRDALEAIGVTLGPALDVRQDGALLDELEEDSRLAMKALAAEERLKVRLTEVRAQVGLQDDRAVFALGTLNVLESTIDWTEQLVALAAGPLEEDRVRRLLALPLDAMFGDATRSALAAFAAAGETLETFVGPTLAPRLRPALEGSFAAARDQIDRLDATADQLPEWWDHVDARGSIVAAGLDGLLVEAHRNAIRPVDLPDAVERSLLSGWMEGVLGSDSRLTNTSSGKRNGRVAEFRRMDERLLSDSASRVIDACAARLPKGTTGGTGIILREAQKKSRHLPVRALFQKAGPVITRLKPCLMMSPLSVSQYVPADWRFDVVIFDEASQIPPQDAINCIYRGSQLIIAGDEKQLPPTSFFEMTGNDEVEDDDDLVLDEFESVLKLAKTAEELAEFGLRWHYRSRHEDLITFSNHEFYDGDLITYPGAIATGPTLGVKHHLVGDGVYHRGKSKDNPREAERVAQIVADHVRNAPGLSIGVVALSSAQAGAIEDAIDAMRRADPTLDRAFRSDRLDGFFVKNLENVQGDDRDIIVLSIGYGPDITGKMTMNFGPMNQSGGWRRLNVAITRARNRMDVVTSFSSDKIRPGGGASSIGTLKAFLEYAEKGRAALIPMTTGGTGEPESPFEEEVLRVIRAWGYEAVPQVGAASYRIDIGIRHPDDADRYVLGIECDGAMYHSSKVARDRDRLRQQVLEGLGWNLYRIWGPAWFRSRRAAEEELRGAIEQAISGPEADNAVTEDPDSSPTLRVDRVERDLEGHPEWAEPFHPFVVRDRYQREVSSQAGRHQLQGLLEQVLQQEGPVHLERITSIAVEAFPRSSGREVQESVQRLLDELTRAETVIECNDGFFQLPGMDLAVRYPLDEEQRRPIEHIAPEEIRLAVLNLVSDAIALEVAELEHAVRDLFGFRRLGSRISTAIDDAIVLLELQGDLLRDAAERLTTSGDV